MWPEIVYEVRGITLLSRTRPNEDDVFSSKFISSFCSRFRTSSWFKHSPVCNMFHLDKFSFNILLYLFDRYISFLSIFLKTASYIYLRRTCINIFYATETDLTFYFFMSVEMQLYAQINSENLTSFCETVDFSVCGECDWFTAPVESSPEASSSPEQWTPFILYGLFSLWPWGVAEALITAEAANWALAESRVFGPDTPDLLDYSAEPEDQMDLMSCSRTTLEPQFTYNTVKQNTTLYFTGGTCVACCAESLFPAVLFCSCSCCSCCFCIWTSCCWWLWYCSSVMPPAVSHRNNA